MAEYYNVTTNQGDVEVANAITNGTKIQITHIAFGDGNGSVPTPTKSRTTLVREVHRQAVTKYERHDTNPNWIVIETVIPSNIGGFTIREMGIIGNGQLISHGSHAPYEKGADPSGVSEYRLKFTQNITDGNVVSITLDESLIFATQAWVEENYIKRSEIVDNLITNDSTKPLSAGQGKVLQDNKLDVSEVGLAGGAASLGSDGFVPDTELKKASTAQAGIAQLINDLVTGGVDKALTAEQGKLLFEMFGNLKAQNGYQKLPGGIIIQWGYNLATIIPTTYSFPITYPNQCFIGVVSDHGLANLAKTSFNLLNKSSFSLSSDLDDSNGCCWISVGY